MQSQPMQSCSEVQQVPALVQLELTRAHSFLVGSLNSGPGGRRFKSSRPDHSLIRPSTSSLTVIDIVRLPGSRSRFREGGKSRQRSRSAHDCRGCQRPEKVPSLHEFAPPGMLVDANLTQAKRSKSKQARDHVSGRQNASSCWAPLVRELKDSRCLKPTLKGSMSVNARLRQPSLRRTIFMFFSRSLNQESKAARAPDAIAVGVRISRSKRKKANHSLLNDDSVPSG